jgi:hypothetical protein
MIGKISYLLGLMKTSKFGILAGAIFKKVKKNEMHKDIRDEFIEHGLLNSVYAVYSLPASTIILL